MNRVVVRLRPSVLFAIPFHARCRVFLRFIFARASEQRYKSNQLGLNTNGLLSQPNPLFLFLISVHRVVHSSILPANPKIKNYPSHPIRLNSKMKLLTFIHYLSLFVLQALAQYSNNAPVTDDNPSKATFQAILQVDKPIQGQITGVSSDNRTGVNFNVNFFDFPDASIGPFCILLSPPPARLL